MRAGAHRVVVAGGICRDTRQERFSNSRMELQRSSGIVRFTPPRFPAGGSARCVRVRDWLAAAGQSWWQVLPLNPPDGLGSPYAGESAFAAWKGLLDPAPRSRRATEPPSVAQRLLDRGLGPPRRHDRRPVRFEREWSALRATPASASASSASRSTSRRGERRPPPIPSSSSTASSRAPRRTSSGRWDALGNPLFDWDAVARGYRWWIERLRRAFALYDLARIDHFRGFAALGDPGGHELDARTGHWLTGPGEALFRAAAAELGELPVIAEDLGLITPDVEELRDALGFPGMAVLLWAFQEQPDNPHALENHRCARSSTRRRTTRRRCVSTGRTRSWQLIEYAPPRARPWR